MENKNNPLVQFSLDLCDYVQSAGPARADSHQHLPVPGEAGQVREWQEAGSRNMLLKEWKITHALEQRSIIQGNENVKNWRERD